MLPVSGGRYQQQMRSGPISQWAMSHTRSCVSELRTSVNRPAASSLANTRTPPPGAPRSRRATTVKPESVGTPEPLSRNVSFTATRE
eukprot:2158315-Alexandrium_andersonii.AAC.1